MELKVHKFVTGSMYVGDWNDAKKCMEGFGSYVFPNGDELRGFFKGGSLHGSCLYSLGSPIGVTIMSTYNNGAIERINAVWFGDKLKVDIPKDQIFDLDNWHYCDSTDRRFANEIFRGMLAVGNVTSMDTVYDLKPNEYDFIGEIYNESTEFSGSKENTKKFVTFVCCPEEVDRIKANVSTESEKNETCEPKQANAHRIIKLNTSAAAELIAKENLRQHTPCVAAETDRRYFERLCEYESVDSDVVTTSNDAVTFRKCRSKCYFYSSSSSKSKFDSEVI